MVERLPKDCKTALDSITRAIGENAVLGVKIACTSSGKNKFVLKVDMNPEARRRGKFAVVEEFFIMFMYFVVNVPAINKMLSKTHPDFLLKPTSFMPLSKLAQLGSFDEDELCVEVLKAMKATMKRALKTYFYHHRDEGVAMVLANDEYGGYHNSGKHALSPSFKCFNELLVWADLNVK